MVLHGLDDKTIEHIKNIIERDGEYQILSMGGGVQSSCLWLMNLQGLITPRAEFAVFSDTGWERKGTYQYLEYLDKMSVEYGFPKIMRVTAGNIRADMLKEGDAHYDHMPLFTDSGNKHGGMLSRQCTGHYKINVIKREVRKIFGMKRRVQWIGFSMDEITRRNDSASPAYIPLRYPLLERKMSRRDCLRWLLENGHPLPVKSSCIGCPFRKDTEWNEMKHNAPDEFADAVDFDDNIRDKHINRPKRVTPQLSLFPDSPIEEPTYDLYLHGSITPLKIINFGDAPEPKVPLTLDEFEKRIDFLLDVYEAEDGESGCSDAEGGCHL